MVASAPYCKVSHIFGDLFSSPFNYLLTDNSRDKTDTRCWFSYQPVLAVMGSCFESFYCHFTFYRTDTSLRQTVGPSHDGRRFRESYRKIPKISPGAYIFQRPFLRGLFLEGLMYGGKFAFQNRLGQLVVGRKFTIFALFYFVFEGKFQVQAPRGAYIRRGDLTEGFLRYEFGGLIFGAAHTWRGLFSEFYGICVENAALNRQIRLPCQWLEGTRQEKFNSTENLGRKFRTIGCFCSLITGSRLNQETTTQTNVTAFSPDLLQKHKQFHVIFIHKNCFRLFLSDQLLFCKILNLNLPFAVCRLSKRDSQSLS